jgi:hypothetical protein
MSSGVMHLLLFIGGICTGMFAICICTVVSQLSVAHGALSDDGGDRHGTGHYDCDS